MIRRTLLVLLFLTPTALVVAWHVGLAWIAQFDPNSPAVTRSAGPIEDIRQVVNEGRRQRALDDVRERLRDGGAQRDVSAAMLTITRTADVAYDRDGLRELLAPYIAGDDELLAVMALDALATFDPRPSDLDAALAICAAWRDEREPLAMRASLLAAFDEGRLRGDAARRVIEATSGDDPYAIDRVVRGLWGTSPSDELGAHLVDLLARCDARADERRWRDLRYDVFYYGLTTFANKPPVVVDALLDELAREWPQTGASRIVWGLGYGVPDERARAVAGALAAAYDAGDVDEGVFALVARHGDATSRAWLTEIAEHPRALAGVRSDAAAALARYDAPEDGR